MKKTITTLTLLLGMTLAGMAQMAGGGLFGRGDMDESNNSRGNSSLMLPSQHNMDGDQGAAPLGSGIAVLLGLGVMYLTAKRPRKTD